MTPDAVAFDAESLLEAICARSAVHRDQTGSLRDKGGSPCRNRIVASGAELLAQVEQNGSPYIMRKTSSAAGPKCRFMDAPLTADSACSNF